MFNRLVESVPAGNNGSVLFYYNQPEIVPHTTVSGVFRFSRGLRSGEALLGGELKGSSGEELNGSSGEALNGSSGEALNGSSGEALNGSSGEELKGSSGEELNGSSGEELNGSSGEALNGSSGEELKGSSEQTLKAVETLSPAEECRGVIESQFLSMRLHLEELPF